MWRRVAGSVRAMRPAVATASDKTPIGKASISAQEPGVLLPVATIRAVNRPPSKHVVQKHAQPKQVQNTLDANWDKKIGAGRLIPDLMIDLHGYNLAAAHHRLDRGLDDAIRDGLRVVLLVTGRPPPMGSSRVDRPLRGIIRESVGDWLAASRHAAAIAAIRNAHPRHGGAGALYIVLRRNR